MTLYGGTGGFTMVGIVGSIGNGCGVTKLRDCALNPGPAKPKEPSCWPVSKKTPPPPRTTVSRPGALWRTYATPRRGAKLCQVVCQSGVPCGANAQVLGP